jgi:multidrug efflux pump subunit AcrA (membrane-fusion protein)
LALALSLGMAGCSGDSAAKDAAPDGSAPTGARRAVVVRAQKPVVRELPIRLQYTAEIQPIQVADIKSIEARGFIRTVRVDKGDRVKKGQVLVTVDCPDYLSRRRQQQQEIRSVRAVYGNAERIYRRLKPMREQNFISQMELDNAKAAFDSSEARLKNAGEISARHRDPGAQVRPGGSPILTLMRIDKVRVLVGVVERDAAYVKDGIPAELTLPGMEGKKFAGKVSRFVRGFDRRTRTLLTEVEIDNPDGVLKPGMYARVSLLVETRPNAVMVPSSAVLTQECMEKDRAMCSWVYVVRQDCEKVKGDCTRRVEVQVGYSQGDEVEILKGVKGDASVVVQGRDLVADGTPVRLMQ